ncbi:NADH-ubiquinone oxidoreductase chain 4L [Pyrolobus fumarii 1A]|uniref:NADH-ubiquinone oxidoreductase chain 4L n=1 Tax=Pyrolobus fumarii (strain DSM 11204 / 1A) TaxID=694429 RepID=G0ED52_PYRF1|nr:NADH-quinone oxidoreductase subunit K [Pyrolobus fumarii]AEM39730.1 NADH-ubiquinone oxidoreductase chain 4L [Pyrolobus fumarii 1A]
MMLSTLPVLLAVFVLIASAVYGILSSRLVLRMLISAELLFNAALVTLLLASATANPLHASILVLLAIILTAAEVGVVAAIIVFLFHEKGGVEIERLRRLRG